MSALTGARPAATDSRGRWAWASLLAGATGIGFAPIFVRLSETGPTATAFYRLLFALPFLWLWASWATRSQAGRIEGATKPATAKQWGLIVQTGLLFTADLSVWHWSLQFTTVANSTLITNVAPVFVTLGAWLFLGEQITRRLVAGMMLALLGAALLVGASYSLNPRHLFGDLLSLVSAGFYAGYLLALKRLRTVFSTPVSMAWAGLVSAAGFGIVAWLSGDVMCPVTARGWWVVLGLALVGHVGGQTLIAFGIGHLPASYSSVSLLWQPVVAALAAWAVLAEALRPIQALGGAVVLAGIALVSSGKPTNNGMDEGGGPVNNPDA